MFTQPAEIDRSRPVFILLNAGLLHRIGPFRLHVLCARRLAEKGFPVLRLDLSGLGYSPKKPEQRGLEAALSDADEVFNWLRDTHSLTQPVLMGSCSGADMAHRIAVADERVRGCVFLDGYAYQNSRSLISYYAARIHRPEIWGDWARKRLLSSSNGSENPGEEEGFWDSGWPTLEEFRADLQRFLGREMPLLFVYSGSVREYNYAGQLFDICPEAKGGVVSVEHFPRANHTYMLDRDRNVLLDAVCDWAEQTYGHAQGA